MKNYKTKKEQARQNAIDWQLNIIQETQKPTLDEFVEAAEKFTKLGKRYGLLKEFKENGIV